MAASVFGKDVRGTEPEFGVTTDGEVEEYTVEAVCASLCHADSTGACVPLKPADRLADCEDCATYGPVCYVMALATNSEITIYFR